MFRRPLCISERVKQQKRNNPRLSILGTSAEGYFWSLLISNIFLFTCSFYRFSDAFCFWIFVSKCISFSEFFFPVSENHFASNFSFNGIFQGSLSRFDFCLFVHFWFVCFFDLPFSEPWVVTYFIGITLSVSI